MKKILALCLLFNVISSDLFAKQVSHKISARKVVHKVSTKPLQINEQEQALKLEVFQLYSSGKYLAAIEKADQYLKHSSIHAELLYIKGLSQSRLEHFDLAEKAFVAAFESGHKSPDFYYEIGQATYAQRSYEKAKKYFRLGKESGYKSDTCQFYLASIEETLEHRDEAAKLYRELADDEKAQDPLRKSSWEKLINWEIEAIEDNEELTKELKKTQIEEKVLPLFEQALAFKFNEPLEARELEIRKKYKLGRFAPRWWSLGLSQDIKNDSNVINQSDDATASKSNQGSLYYKSEVEGGAKLHLPYEIVTNLKARANTTWYQENDNSDIYTNNADAFTPSAKVERNLKDIIGIDLSPSLMVEYSHNRKDWQKRKRNDFYSKSFTYGVGVAGDVTGLGSSSVQFRYKPLESYTTTSDSNTYTLIANQTIKLPWKHVLIGLYTGTWLRMLRTPTKDTDSNLFRVDYLLPDFLTLYWDVAMSYTVTDTKAQDATRGTEKNYSPSLKIGKKFLDYFDVAWKTEYTEQKSKDYRNYKYDKWVTGLELGFKY